MSSEDGVGDTTSSRTEPFFDDVPQILQDMEDTMYAAKMYMDSVSDSKEQVSATPPPPPPGDSRQLSFVAPAAPLTTQTPSARRCRGVHRYSWTPMPCTAIHLSAHPSCGYSLAPSSPQAPVPASVPRCSVYRSSALLLLLLLTPLISPSAPPNPPPPLGSYSGWLLLRRRRCNADVSLPCREPCTPRRRGRWWNGRVHSTFAIEWTSKKVCGRADQILALTLPASCRRALTRISFCSLQSSCQLSREAPRAQSTAL